MRTKAGYTSQMKARYSLIELSRCFTVPVEGLYSTKMINNNSLPRVQYPAMKNKQTEKKKNASDQDEVNGDTVGVGGGGKILNGNNQKGIYIEEYSVLL